MRQGAALLLGLASVGLCAASLWPSPSPVAEALASFLPFAFGLAILGGVVAPRRGAWLLWAILLSGLAISATKILAEWIVPPAPVAQTGDKVVVVIHNLRRDNADPVATRELLNESGADILLLQEANGTMRAELANLRQRYPYGTRCPRPCDTVILSRLPLGPMHWRIPDGRGEGLPLLWAKVLPGSPSEFTVISLHMPWPLFQDRHSADQRTVRSKLSKALGEMDRRRLILGGDFNLTPWGRGMSELDRALAPMERATRGQLSFPSRIDNMATPPILPIDQLYAGSAWSIGSVERLPRSGSDHFALRITLFYKGDS